MAGRLLILGLALMLAGVATAVEPGDAVGQLERAHRDGTRQLNSEGSAVPADAAPQGAAARHQRRAQQHGARDSLRLLQQRQQRQLLQQRQRARSRPPGATPAPHPAVRQRQFERQQQQLLQRQRPPAVRSRR